MSKHTPEPWEYSCGAIFQERGSVSIARTHGAELFQGAMTDRDAISERIKEDARRIVACVNACRGLPTDELEQKGLIAAVGSDLLELDGQLAEIKQQRDELLAALEDIIAYNVQYATDKYGDASKAETMSCVQRSRAAISKAKGGAA